MTLVETDRGTRVEQIRRYMGEFLKIWNWEEFFQGVFVIAGEKKA